MTNVNPFSVEGKKYLITGAASGIGRCASILLSRLGANLILLDINETELKKTKAECKTSDKVIVLDLETPSLIKNAVLDAISEFGKLNGVIHLAGRPYISPLKSISEEKCHAIYSINTYAAIELAKVFSNSNVYDGKSGSIVFISSVYALVGSAANVGYAMSKAALHGITKSLSVELAPKGIRVNCIAPGFVKSNMMKDIKDVFEESHSDTLEKLHPLGIGEAEDVANSIVFLLSDASKWVTGTILSVDGGFTAQ